MSQHDWSRARWLALSLVPACVVWFTAAPALAEEPKAKPAKLDPQLDTEPAQFIRFVEDGKGGGQLDVATATYKNDSGVTVRLVGVVHIGDKKFFEGLEKSFEKYDAVLYEMVKPAATGAPVRGQRTGSMVGMFQTFLKDVLELDFQLDAIDYTKPNFVHADLDAETFAKMQEERGESIMGLMLAQMMRELAKEFEGGGKNQGPQMGLMELVEAFQSPDRARQFKLILGRNFNNVEEQMAGFNGSVLTTERNKKALSVLKDTIAKGKKDIAVFYGAAHMNDLEARLALMGFKRAGIEWRTAWDMRTKGNDAKAEERKGRD
jgi:hypothetical protein